MGKFGAKNWVFCDGDLPPAGDNPDFQGHEALMITNVSDADAKIDLRIIFEDKDPASGNFVTLKSQRTMCIRLDKPIGDKKYIIPKGQYALHLISNTPVCAVFGRLDVRQVNMAYYSVNGVNF